MSQGDPNIELEIVETQWKERAQILRIESTRHNPLRKPESEKIKALLLGFFELASMTKESQNCTQLLKKSFAP
jgi:uncharacterized protein YhhL (DUF1145 family)